MMDIQGCFVCERIERIRTGSNPYFVREMETGYVVLGDVQRFRGYTVFICKACAAELHELPLPFRLRFLEEMSMVAEAVYRAFRPDKLNYELLGTGNAVHMHWHIFPRRTGDTPKAGPVWRLPAEEMNAEKYRPDREELERLKKQLGDSLDEVLGGCASL